MTIFYDGTFPGSATSPGTVTDSTTVGATGQWVDVLGGIWKDDGSGHVVDAVDDQSFYDGPLLQSGATSSVGSKRDVGITVYLEPLNTLPNWAVDLNIAVNVALATRYAAPAGFSGTIAVPRFTIGVNTSNLPGATVQSSVSYQVAGVERIFGAGTATLLTGLSGTAGYLLRMELTGTSPASVRQMVIDAASGAILGEHTWSDSLDPTHPLPSAAGPCGFTQETSLSASGAGHLNLIKRVVIDDGTAYAAPPLAAGTLSNTTDLSNSVVNQMTAPTGGTPGYTGQLKRSLHGAGSYSNVGSPVSISGTSSYTDSTVAASTSYDYKVTVTDGASGTADSNVLNVVTPSATLAAGTLSNVTDLFNSVVNQMTVPTGGTPPDTGQMQRSPHGAGTWTNVGSPVTPLTATTGYTDSTVAAATSYDYRVHVTDSASGSAFSNVLNVVTPAAPSGSKPTNPALAPGHPFAATLKCMVPFSESVASSLPQDIVTNTLLYPVIVSGNSTALGPDPKPTGYNAAGIIGPAAKCVDNGPAVSASVATTASAGPETHAVVFRADLTDAEAPQNTNMQLTRSERAALSGHGLTVTNTVPSDSTPAPATPAVTKIGYGCRASGGGFTYYDFLIGGNPITLSTSHWYAAAASLSGSVVTLFLYDLTTATLITPSGGTALTLTGSLVGYQAFDAFFTLNGDSVFPYWGSKSCALCDGQAWNDTLFSNFVNDPWAASRGPVPVGTGGTLVAGVSAVESRETGNVLNCTHPTGGAASAAFGFQWVYTEGDPSQAQSTWTVLAGATSREWLDAAATVDVPRWYSCRQTDGTSTVYTPVNVSHAGTTNPGPQSFGCRLRGYVRGGWSGTSIIRAGIPIEFGVAAMASGYAVVNINRAVSATSAAQWANTASFHWLPALIQSILNSGGDTLFIQHGPNDVSAGQVGAGFAANMTTIIGVAQASGLKVVIFDAPWRFDNLTDSWDISQNNAAQNALANGSTVLLADAKVNAFANARFPGFSGDGLHDTGGLGDGPAGIACWVSYLRNVLEPSSGSAPRPPRPRTTGL